MGLLKWLFKGRKREEVVEEKTSEEKVAESTFPKVHSDLLSMQNRLASPSADIDKEKIELERIRDEYTHLDRKQRKELSGLYKSNEERIEKAA